jgi:hypothetical protein
MHMHVCKSAIASHNQLFEKQMSEPSDGSDVPTSSVATGGTAGNRRRFKRQPKKDSKDNHTISPISSSDDMSSSIVPGPVLPSPDTDASRRRYSPHAHVAFFDWLLLTHPNPFG